MDWLGMGSFGCPRMTTVMRGVPAFFRPALAAAQHARQRWSVAVCRLLQRRAAASRFVAEWWTSTDLQLPGRRGLTVRCPVQPCDAAVGTYAAAAAAAEACPSNV